MNILQQVTGSRVRVLGALAVALALCLSPASAQAQSKKLFVVSVGINNAIGQPPLKAVAKDALDMAKWAQGQQGKLFSQVHVTPLIDQQATKNQVLASLAGLQAQVTANDMVIFYVSCHGGANGGEYHFCAYDGNVYWSQIKDALRNVQGVKMVIIDTCHAGAADPQGDNLIVFAACEANQFSHDGSSAAGNSVYTEYLLEALTGNGDRDKNGYISLSEAASYSAAKLKAIYQNKAPQQQQFSMWYLPKGQSTELAMAKVGAGVAAPVNTGVVEPAKTGAVAVVGTWSGSENLKGYGNLTFVLTAGGQATMYDAKGVVPGTWSQQGNQVTLNFAQVQATYQGTITGTQMTGQGFGSNGGAWSFSVSKTK